MNNSPVASVNSSVITVTSNATEIQKHEEEDDLEYILDNLKESGRSTQTPNPDDISMNQSEIRQAESLNSSVVNREASNSASSGSEKTVTAAVSASVNNQQGFPDSYDTGAVFLKSLLDSYYLKKLQDKSTIENFGGDISIVRESSESKGEAAPEPKREEKALGKIDFSILNSTPTGASSSDINSDIQLKPQSPREEEVCLPCSSNNKPRKSRLKCSLLGIMILIVAAVLANGAIDFVTELDEANNQIAELKLNLELSKNLLKEKDHKLGEYSESVKNLTKKNSMLLRMAEKVVEEEKRNCDFFDVLSIVTSAITSKREKNLQELCLQYYRYSELEYNANPNQERNTIDIEPVLLNEESNQSAKQKQEPKTNTFSSMKDTFASIFSNIQEKVKEIPNASKQFISSWQGDTDFHNSDQEDNIESVEQL